MEYGQGGQDGGYNRGGYNQGGYNEGGYNHGNSDYNKPSQPNFNFGNGNNSTPGGGGGGQGLLGCFILVVCIAGIVLIIPAAVAALLSSLLLMIVLKATLKPSAGMSWWKYYKTAFYTGCVYLLVYTLSSVVLYYINKPAYTQYLNNDALTPQTLKDYLHNSGMLLRFGVSTLILHTLCILASAGVLRKWVKTYSNHSLSYLRATGITLIVILPCLIITIGLIFVLVLTKSGWV